jgi:Tol biopolymer transport system component
VILGTAAYMSPEQARGRAVDKRADIWAFGVVFVEMLTGRQLYQGETVSDTLAAVLKEQPDLSVVPARLKPAIERCLSRDPSRRWRDISDLKWALGQSGLSHPEQQPTTDWRLAVITAAVIALFGGALGAWFLKPSPTPDHPLLQMEISAPPGTSFGPYGVGELKVSPNGRFIVFFASSKDGRRMLWLRPLDSNAAIQLAGTEGSTTLPFWSPDSQWIAFLANGKLQKVSVAGGPPQVVCDLAAPAFTYTLGSWNSAGVILLTQSSGIQRISDSGGGKLASVLQLDTAHGETAQIDPAFLPDGVHFLYSSMFERTGYAPSEQGLKLASLDGKLNRLLIDGSNLGAFAPGVSGQGWILYTSRQPTLWARPFDPQKREFKGEPVFVADGVPLGPSWSASDNGVLAFRRSPYTHTQLVWTARDGTALGTVGDAGQIEVPRISPNQKTIAFNRTDQKTSDIWMFDTTANLTKRFTFNGAGIPVWSSDGKRIVHSALPQSVVEQSADGIGAETVLIKGRNLLHDVSRDGRWLVTQGQDLEHIELWSRGSGDKPAAVLEGYQGAMSPDGRWLLYTANPTGRSEIFVRSLPKEAGGAANAEFKFQLSTNGGGAPMWRADGKEIFFLAPDSTMMAVPVQSSENLFRATASPKALFATRVRFDEYVREYDVTPDGKRFLLNQPLASASETPITVIVNWPKLLERKQ